MFVTLEVSQSDIISIPAALQFVPPPPSLTGLHQFSPEGTATRQFTTAILSASLSANGAATDPGI